MYHANTTSTFVYSNKDQDDITMRDLYRVPKKKRKSFWAKNQFFVNASPEFLLAAYKKSVSVRSQVFPGFLKKMIGEQKMTCAEVENVKSMLDSPDEEVNLLAMNIIKQIAKKKQKPSSIKRK